MRRTLGILAVFAAILCAASLATAGTVTHAALPGQVPDEQPPRANLGDAPTGFGPDSWQGSATGKVNWHARYVADGDYLSVLFPTEAATLSIGDLQSISYYTKDAVGDDNRDWWIKIYTRTDGIDDKSSWYGYRFTSNYNDNVGTGAWQRHSTDASLTFSLDAGAGSGVEHNVAGLAASWGSEKIEMISVQTDSGWGGFDGYIDGLEIALTNGSVGRVNFEAVPLPAAAWGGMLLLGTGGLARLRRKARK